jgi:hypothetical protein
VILGLLTGDTRLKATRFFLAALAYLDLQVSPLLLRDKTKSLGNGSATRRRRAPKPERVLAAHAMPSRLDMPETAGRESA